MVIILLIGLVVLLMWLLNWDIKGLIPVFMASLIVTTVWFDVVYVVVSIATPSPEPVVLEVRTEYSLGVTLDEEQQKIAELVVSYGEHPTFVQYKKEAMKVSNFFTFPFTFGPDEKIWWEVATPLDISKMEDSQ